MSSAERVALILVAAFAAGCATVNAPPGFLPTPEQPPGVHGAWIDLRILTSDTSVRALSGELLAVTRDSLWILEPDKGGHVVARRGVSGELGFYAPELGALRVDVLLGSLATVSNGVILVLTAPAWWITGTVGAMADARAAVRSLSDDPLDAKISPLAAYARYPQGIPRGMDAAYIRVRP